MGKPLTVLSLATAVLALAACAADQGAGNAPQVASRAPVARAAPGGVIRHGDSFAEMSRQYAPRAGSVVATGASAWVPSAPPPAFVARGPLPPADAPAPPPAAVANRQPGQAAAAPASDVARPEAAAPPARDPAVRTAGLALFNANGCAACHAFDDAGAYGVVGPPLDGQLAVRTVVNTLTEGRGVMPSFKGAMSDAEILTLANYLAQYSR